MSRSPPRSRSGRTTPSSRRPPGRRSRCGSPGEGPVPAGQGPELAQSSGHRGRHQQGQPADRPRDRPRAASPGPAAGRDEALTTSHLASRQREPRPTRPGLHVVIALNGSACATDAEKPSCSGGPFHASPARPVGHVCASHGRRRSPHAARAAGQAGAAALAGRVLVDRSRRRVRAARGRRWRSRSSPTSCSRSSRPGSPLTGRPTCGAGCAGGPSARTSRRWSATPVGELLDRIDSDVYQVPRRSGERRADRASRAARRCCRRSPPSSSGGPPGSSWSCWACLLVVSLAGPLQRIAPARMREEEAWSDLAAVMEEAIHGQDDVRTSLARPMCCGSTRGAQARCMRRGALVWTASARISAIAAGAVRGGIALLVVGGALALATGRIDGARLTAVWLLALAYGATVEMISRMVSELQYAPGGVATRPAAARRAAGAGGRPRGPATPTLSSAGSPSPTPTPWTRGRYRAALRNVRLTFRRGRSYAVIGRTGSGKSTLAKVLTRAVDAAARHRLPRRRRPARPGRGEPAPLDRGRPAAHGDPGRHARGEHRAVRPGAARRAPRTPWRSWGSPAGSPSCRTASRPGWATAATSCPPVRSSWWRSRGSWCATRTWSSSTRPPPGWTRSPRARVQRATERLLRDRIGIVIAHRLSSVQPLRRGRRARPTARCWRRARCARSARSPNCSRQRRAGVPRSRRRTRRDADEELLGGADAAEALDAVLAAETRAANRRRRRTRRRCPTRRRRGRCARSLRLVTNDAALRARRGRAVHLLSILGLDGAVLPWLWAQLVDGSGPVFWPAVGIAAALVVTMPIPYYTAALVPEVVGHADAADQPAPGARADRAAAGQRAHAGGGGRPGRGHRAGGHHGGQRVDQFTSVVLVVR